MDAVREVRPPFSPSAVVDEFATLLKSYRVSKVVGDHYGGEFVKEPFRRHGISYEVCKQPEVRSVQGHAAVAQRWPHHLAAP